jgi:hypothetical protein
METVDRDEIAARRHRAVKTAWVLGAIAALIFVMFILSGVVKS